MPRNINYELKAKSQLIKRNLSKQNAIVDAISKGNITKAEFLSGEELIESNPIQQALLKKQAKKEQLDKDERRHTNENIIAKLQEISDKPNFDYNKFVQVFRRMMNAEKTC